MNTQPPIRQRKTRIGAGASGQPPKTEFIYHWNRIIGALAGLVLLIVLVGFGIQAWLSSPSAPSGDAGLEDVGTPVVPLEAAPESGAQVIGTSAAQPAGSTISPDPVAPVQDAPSTTDAAMPADTASPRDEDVPARSQPQPTAEGDLPRVFLPPDTRVNLRAEPALSSPVLRILDAGAELRLLERDEAFYQVRSDEGIVGWVSRDFSSLTPYATPAP
ncbi:SH3 domain-containing protein [Thioalkalivibrio sp.]|uniref:SH3 domain-containing protein n=1 Tax=Thioalkalivibrio sp. TaxID=2093813 RepID=UPI003976B69C